MNAHIMWRRDTLTAMGLLVCAAGCVIEQPDTAAQAKPAAGFVVEDVVVFLPQEPAANGEAPATSEEGVAVQKLIIRENDLILIREGGRGQLIRFNDKLGRLRWEERDAS